MPRGARTTADHREHTATEQRRQPHNQRGPQQRSDEEVTHRLPQPAAHHAGCNIGGQPHARQKAADQDDDTTALLEPCRTSGDILFAHKPRERRVAQRRAPQRTPQQQQQHIAHEDAHKARRHRCRKGDASLCHQHTRRHTRQVLARQGCRRQHTAEQKEREALDHRQLAGIEGLRRCCHPRRVGIGAAQRSGLLDTLQKRAQDLGRLFGVLKEQKMPPIHQV
jgi:hypothetical protein